MSSKKISIGGKPSTRKPAENVAVDAWVGSRAENAPKEPMKRLTIDIPAELHAKLKSDCAMRGRKMADEIRDLLQEKYGKS
ncbi:hypothetical protein LG290_16575 (plasmid) [Halomonas sediminis]